MQNDENMVGIVLGLTAKAGVFVSEGCGFVLSFKVFVVPSPWPLVISAKRLNGDVRSRTWDDQNNDNLHVTTTLILDPNMPTLERTP